MAQAHAADTNVTGGGTLNVSAGDTLGTSLLLDDGTLMVQDPLTISVTTTTLGPGGGTIDTNGYATTLNSALQGGGTFTKTGAGVLTFIGMNTYTGATAVTQGTLALSGQGRLDRSSSVTVSTGATLDVSAATAASVLQLNGAGSVVLGNNNLEIGSGAFSGIISGDGGISVNTGSLTLTGNNTFTGQASSGAGVLQIGDGGTIGYVVGNILNTGSLVFNRSDALTYNGLITGNGASTFTGGGTYVLTQDSSASGAWTIDAGTTVQWGNGGATGWLGGGPSVSVGPVVNNGTLIINRSGDRIYQGAIGGSGSFAIEGSGVVTLSKTNTYTGATDVKDGGLLVLGSIASSSLTNVHSGAMLASTGAGTLGDTRVLHGGILAPGNLSSRGSGKLSSIGTMNVAGNVTFESGSVLDIQVTKAGLSDKVSVAGSATIDPAALVRVRALNGTDDGSTYAPDTTYTILSTTGGVTGQFNNNVDEQFAFLDAALKYVGNDVQLNLTRNDVTLPDVASTANQQSSASALAGFDQTDAIYQQLLGLTAEQAQNAYDSVSGEAHASGQQVLDQTFALFTSSLIGGPTGGGAAGARQTSVLGYVEVPASSNPGLAAIDEAEQTTVMSNLAWLAPLGGVGTVRGNGNAAEIHWASGGLALGYEGVVATGDHKLTYGAGLGYLASRGELAGRASTYETQGGFVGVYGDWADGAWALSGNLAYGASHVSTRRDITVGAVSRTATAGYWAQSIGAELEAGYGFKLTEQMTLKPLGMLGMVWSGHGGATETGAGSLNGTIAAAGKWQVDIGLGVELAHTMSLSNGADLTLKARGLWQHALTDPASSQNLALAGNSATPINVRGAAADRDRFVLGLGVDYAPTEETRLSLNYTGTFSGAQSSHVAGASVGFAF
ncbi:hypothetical protein VW29_00615 [Devosia limi DSM 17137]|uniref:Autotransporter-associated beta strand repeat-containing protein n=2 Tax=Devosia TaxID=46913 RepID=A0A0F5LX91_9HYPH|nr:hypothetical protein VW29_00615 [Devosia limi DSM 17137]SHF94341.1 autotransporter-associated beta strand repeat-containing protein [Devosia limi DSM 17137]